MMPTAHVARFIIIVALACFVLDAAEAQMLPVMENARAQPSAPPALAYDNSFSPQFSSEEAGWRLSAGADLIVIAPRFESNPAYTSTTAQAGPGGFPLTTQRYSEFHYDYALSPRVWLGAENQDGLGARVRWWRYNHAAPTLQVDNSPIPPGSSILSQTVISQSPLMAIGPQTSLPTILSQKDLGPNPLNATTDELSFANSLTMNVWDFEGTLSDLAIGRWSFLLSGGLRYAQLNQTYNAVLQFEPGAALPPLFLNSAQTFNGLGPTLALEARRGWERLGLTLTGGARAALLFGSDRHSVAGFNYELLPTPTLGFHSSASARTRSVPVFEMEFGAERVVPLGNFDWILRGGVLSQLWPVGSGAHANGNMALIGFTAGTGIRF